MMRFNQSDWAAGLMLLAGAACSSGTTSGDNPLNAMQTTNTAATTATGSGGALGGGTGGALLGGTGGSITPALTGGDTALSTGGVTPVGTGGVTPVGTGGVTPVGTGGVTPATGGAVAGTGGTVITTPGVGTCLAAGSGQYTEPGPYAVATQDVTIGSSGDFRIFYPNPLEASCPHPIVAWGNGTGVSDFTTYEFLNKNAASWGMVVIASNNSSTGSGAFHTAGIDYLLSENDNASSMFYQKLDTKAAVTGHSQGGIGAQAASSHPNVVTASIEGMEMTATAKVSVLVLTGTADITNPDALAAKVPTAPGPMFVANWEGGDHVVQETLAGYITADPGALQFQRLHAAWLRCFLAGDEVACDMFSGGTPSNCGICGDTGWHALTSNIP